MLDFLKIQGIIHLPRGEIIKIVDKQSNVVKEETFKAFGEQLTSTGSFNNTHRFTGKEYEESGIYYFGARYYDPTLGRFLTPDPAGLYEQDNPLTLNPFIYCSNNPLIYIDPDGNWQTKNIDGRLIVHTPKLENYLAKTIASNIPVIGANVEAFNAILRISSGDRTFKDLEVPWTVARIADNIAGTNLATAAEKLHRVLFRLMQVESEHGYEAYSELIQTQVIDPKTFESIINNPLFSKYGLEVIDTGGELQIDLTDLEEADEDKFFEELKKLSDKKTEEEREKKWWILWFPF